MDTSEEKVDHSFGRSEHGNGEGDKPDIVYDTTLDTSKPKGGDDTQGDTKVDCNEDDQQVEMNEESEKRNVASGFAVQDVCPFVCGICSEKFDKVSVFYAHLKSHENFDVISQMNKKNEMLEALDVQGKVNENIFKCGICQIEFPSMSLLHEHMVGEENISDYSYSNADHTARPASRVVLSQSDSDNDNNEAEIIVSSPRNVRGRKRKTAGISTAGTQTNKKSMVTGKIMGSRKTKPSSKILIEKDGLMKSRNRKKRKKEETSSSEDVSCNDDQKLRKMKTADSEDRVLFESSLEHTSDVKTYGTRGNLSPLARSSQRISNRSAKKRVDYKALAGLGSIRSDSEFEEDSTLPKKFSLKSKEKKAEKSVEKRHKNSKSVTKMMQDDKDSASSAKDVEEIKENKNQEHSESIKVVSVKYVETDKTDKEESVLKDDIATESLNSGNANYDSVISDNDMVESSDFEETEEIEIREDDDSAEEPTVKDDGTLIDVTSDTNTAIKVELDSDYVYNASDDDSDDDFREEETLDDEENDPYFEPQADTEYDNEGNVIVSLQNTRDPKQYLKKFKVKKKRIVRKNKDGQPVKNCMYPCAICGRYYLWKALKKHMYAHVKVKAVQCSQCGKNYKSTRHLKDHIRSVHAMKKYGCPKCSSILKGNQSFEKHIMMHILKKEINEALDEVEKVEVPEEDYIKWKSQQELLNGDSHYRKKKKKIETVTEGVPERLSKEEGLDLDLLKDGPLHGDHIVLEDDIVGTTKNQYCKICRQNFPTHESMVQHLLEHNDDEQFSCKICKGFFQTQEYLQNHMVTVHGERDLVCDICGERLRSSYALWTHKGKHLMKKDEYYSEEIVQKLQEEIAERKNRKNLNKLKNETKKCDICGMVVLAVRFKRHLEVHTTTKDWECELCHNFYKTRRYLIDHMKKTHNAEKVSCDICGQTFKGKTYLEIHKQTHGPKDKQCPHCGKGFTTIMYLKTHMVTHEEKKRFRCNTCKAAFSHKQRLAIHMVEVHGEGASRPCKYCGDLFPSRQKARRHERIAHEGFITPTPTRMKKKSNFYNVVKVNEPDNESLQNKIVRLMPPGPNYVTVSPGVVKVPISKNTAVASNTHSFYQKNIDSTLPEVGTGAAGSGQFIKLGNGEEYQVMIEKEGDSESLEFVELTEEEQNVIIQEADGAISQSPMMEEQDENIEQILEIPENAEQCQILLYPDGTFKLLNVVDNTN